MIELWQKKKDYQKINTQRGSKSREKCLLLSSILSISGVGIGGFSPLVTGDEMNVYNYTCVIGGLIATALFVYMANSILKPNVKF